MFVTHTVAMAGANSSMLRLILELRENYQVEPVVLMPHVHPAYAKRNLLKSCLEHHIECYSYRFYWFKERRTWKSYLKCFSNALWYPRILWALRSQQFDIIHSNGSVISLGALISRSKRVPHVWHLREFGNLDFNLHSLLGPLYEKWVYRHADAYIAISEIIKSHFAALIPPEKIRTIYNGVAVPETMREEKHNKTDVQLCMLGLVSESKNQKEALRAVDLLVHREGVRHFHLSFVGHEEYPYIDELRTFVATHGLGDYVTFMGERSNVDELLNTMNIGLMLSQSEAFGRVTVEYMMHEMAVIASDTGANREIVVDGVTGCIYPLGNVEALTARMKQLIADHALIGNYGTAGKKRALSLFTSERNTFEVYQVYSCLTC